MYTKVRIACNMLNYEKIIYKNASYWRVWNVRVKEMRGERRSRWDGRSIAERQRQARVEREGRGRVKRRRKGFKLYKRSCTGFNNLIFLSKVQSVIAEFIWKSKRLKMSCLSRGLKKCTLRLLDIGVRISASKFSWDKQSTNFFQSFSLSPACRSQVES